MNDSRLSSRQQFSERAAAWLGWFWFRGFNFHAAAVVIASLLVARFGPAVGRIRGKACRETTDASIVRADVLFRDHRHRVSVPGRNRPVNVGFENQLVGLVTQLRLTVLARDSELIVETAVLIRAQ